MAFKGALFEFQEPAVRRMLERRRLLLAFEMGLGKTVIVLAACEELLDTGRIATAVIICPASLKYQWRRMIEKFTEDGATVLLVEGTPAQREKQYAVAVTGEPDYVILNYEQCVNDWAYVSKLPMDCIVCDEVQAIKSFRSKRSRRVKRLRSIYRFGLTGQPLENRPEEVYSIMQWIEKELLGPFELFDRTFISRTSWGSVNYYKNLPTLHRRLGKAMVRKRRDDPDVSDQLPKVLEEAIPVPFDQAGGRLYNHIVDDLLTELASAKQMFGNFNVFKHYSTRGSDDGAEAAARGRVMSRLTCLRMLCDHPELLRKSARLANATRANPVHSTSSRLSGSAYAVELAEAGYLDGLSAAPKFAAAVGLISDIAAADHKCVVFSFFKESLYQLAEAMGQWRPVLFTGELTPKARDQAKQKFAYDDHCRLFLSSDAGGVGLDLPEASYLVNYNLPWSAGKFDQRQARIIRLSSEWKSVTLTTMLMAGSIEERMHALLLQKRAVADAVVDGRGIDKQGRLSLDLDSLSQFLSNSTVI